MEGPSQRNPLYLKITLSIALVTTLAAFIFFGLSTTKGKESQDTFQRVGEICLVSGSVLLFVSAVQYVFIGNKGGRAARVEYLTPATQVSPKVSKNKGEKMLVIISADSWCGFSKKMSAEVPTLKSLLEPMGVEVVLVSDIKEKEKFQNLSVQYSPQGFPHSVLIIDGTKIADIPGYMTASQLQEVVSSKL